VIFLLGLGVIALGGLAIAALRALPRRGEGIERRVGPIVGGLVAAALGFALIGGVDSSYSIIVLACLGFAGPALAFLVLRRPGRTTERSWSGPAAREIALAFTARAGKPAPAAVARALGRVEARELSQSVWFGVGIGFCLLIYAIFGFVYSADNSETWEEYLQLTPWFVHPLVGMSVLAGHRAVTRARRDGAEELFDSCPTPPVTRTIGFLLAGTVPLATIVVFLGALVTTSAVRSEGLHGPLGGDSVADLLGAVVLGAGGVALGVALGRWLRFALVPVVAVVGIALASGAINTVGGGDWNPLTALATAPTIEGPSPVFLDRAPAWHVLWLVGLTAVVAIAAVARHRRDRPVAVVGAMALVVVLVAGIGATRPLSPASAERIAAVTADPEAHQRCVETSGPVSVCAFALHRALLEATVARVEPIAAALPPEVRPVTLRQVFDGDLADLPPEVRRLLTAADLLRPDGEVPLGFGGDSGFSFNDAGLDVALAAAGLPLEAGDDLVPEVITGQARGVVALWLATRGLDHGQIADAVVGAHPSSSDPFERGVLEIDPCAAPSVAWSAQDLAAARAVIDLPERDVLEVVHAEWARWTDPSTGTDELLDSLGLPRVGPFDRVIPRPGSDC
jgi:hypothetical protein